MARPHFRSQFGDTTHTKVFVGGLAWETPTEEMRGYFEQFGEILEAVIIKDKATGRSKGYGFVTFRDPESARGACENPNPVIDGRRANCNIAALGQARASPPRGRMQGGSFYSGGAPPYGTAPEQYPAPAPAPPPLPPPAVYPPYGYPNYTPDYGYHQDVYNPQIQQPQYHQLYGSPSSSVMGSPFFYGYPWPAPRGAASAPQAQRIPGPLYLYPVPGPLPQPTRNHPPLPLPSTESQTSQGRSTDDRVAASESASN